MSNNVFPNLPGLDIEVARTPSYATTINQTASGQEQRTSWRANPRYRYKLKFNVLRTDTNAPAPYAAFTEVGVVLSFLDTHKGSFDSFLFNDPYSGTQARVRFVEDSMTITKVLSGVWKTELELISVLA